METFNKLLHGIKHAELVSPTDDNDVNLSLFLDKNDYLIWCNVDWEYNEELTDLINLHFTEVWALSEGIENFWNIKNAYGVNLDVLIINFFKKDDN